MTTVLMKIYSSEIMKSCPRSRSKAGTGIGVDGCASVAHKLCVHEGFPERSHLM